MALGKSRALRVGSSARNDYLGKSDAPTVIYYHIDLILSIILSLEIDNI